MGRGDPISAGNLDRGDPISAGDLDGGGGGSHLCRKPRWGDPIPTGSQMLDPISAGNLDGGGGFPFVQET